MNELERILALQKSERKQDDIEYLELHKNELNPQQQQQLDKENEKPVKNTFNISINKIKVMPMTDEDTMMFSQALPITDSSEQYNGTKYDIASMNTDGYKGVVTTDHGNSIHNIVGKVINLKKGYKQVTIDGIKFATKENAEAIFAMNMLKGGFVTDFSIETLGPYPEEDGIYKNSELVGLSMVIVGNNKSATLNQIAKNSISEAKKQGLDTTGLENEYVVVEKNGIDNNNDINNNVKDMKIVTIKNSRNFAIEVTYKNAAGDETKTTLITNATVDVSEDQKEAIEKQINDAKEPQENIAEIVKNAMTPLTAKIAELEKQIFDNSAKEPQFRLEKSNEIKNELGKMSGKERGGKQIQYAWDWLSGKSINAHNKLTDINKFHMEKLQEEGIVENSVSLSDFGNFVISPELLKDIEGFRSNFQPLISKLDFRETLSLQMAWLNRNGDISMSEVSNEDANNGNLKPISEYSASIKTANLQELAAVTPVCTNATRFLAADLLTDVAAGYREDYDRKRAQLFIARLQQATDLTGQTKQYATTSDINSMKSFIDVAASMQEDVMNGVYILSQKSYWEMMKRQMGAGVNTETGFQIFTKGENGPLMLGSSFIIVPNELMPTLNSAETKVFVVEGVSVTVNQGVFFVDLSTFSGRTSGGLNYDMSMEAAYEVSGVVKSSFQRNELILRGAFFRGGAIRNVNKVIGLGSRGFS